jgi:hypothetical protein
MFIEYWINISVPSGNGSTRNARARDGVKNTAPGAATPIGVQVLIQIGKMSFFENDFEHARRRCTAYQ